MPLPMVHNVGEVEALIREVGFLPFCRCEIPGFSLQECTPKDRWFVKDVEGPWEWREMVAEKGEIAYGKLIQRKKAFVSRAFYPDFVNYRRDGMDFDLCYEQGRASRNEKLIMDALQSRGSLMTHEIKSASGVVKGFETAITALQMRAYITTERLDYRRDAFGRPYGWGVARYALSEAVFGEAFVCSRYGDSPERSYRRLFENIAKHFPNASEREIRTVLR